MATNLAEVRTEHENSFKRLLQIDVSKHIDKKGQFNYLSWPFAVSQLRLVDPQATWEVKRFNGHPFLQTELGYFVEVAVSVSGVTLSQIHPVLDSRNKPIAKPTTFDINTSIQRCLVKAISLHGLGLSIYAGEDLPSEQPEGKAMVETKVTPLSTPSAKSKPNGENYLRAVPNELEPVSGAVEEPAPTPSIPAVITAAQLERLTVILDELDLDVARVVKYSQKIASVKGYPMKDNLADLPLALYGFLLEQLPKMAKAIAGSK